MQRHGGGGQRSNWTCNACNNLNYGHRDVCNRCPQTREQNELNDDAPPMEDARGLIGRKRARLQDADADSPQTRPQPGTQRGGGGGGGGMDDVSQQVANLRAQLELRDDELRSERNRNSDLNSRVTALQSDIEDLEERQRARAKQHAEELAAVRQETERLWSRRLEDAESEADRMRQVARRRQEDLEASEQECERVQQRLRALREGGGGGGQQQQQQQQQPLPNQGEYGRDRDWQRPRSRSRSRSHSPPRGGDWNRGGRSPPRDSGWSNDRGGRQPPNDNYGGGMAGDRRGQGGPGGGGGGGAGGGIYTRVDDGSVPIDAERVNHLILTRDGFRRQRNWGEADRLQKDLHAMVSCARCGSLLAAPAPHSVLAARCVVLQLSERCHSHVMSTELTVWLCGCECRAFCLTTRDAHGESALHAVDYCRSPLQRRTAVCSCI
jgi:hypothetical protein